MHHYPDRAFPPRELYNEGADLSKNTVLAQIGDLECVEHLREEAIPAEFTYPVPEIRERKRMLTGAIDPEDRETACLELSDSSNVDDLF